MEVPNHPTGTENSFSKSHLTYAHCVTSCKILAKMDKISGNESKMHMSSQIYGFFQLIFQIFRFLPIFQALEFKTSNCGYSKMSQ